MSSATAGAAGHDQGFAHRGVLYHSPQDLVAAVLPQVRRALEDGDTVSTAVDRSTVDAMRDALGPSAARVEFGPSAAMHQASAQSFLRDLRARARHDRRALVLGQFSVYSSADECSIAEGGANVVLSDLDLTLLCACPRDASPGTLAVLRDSHPQLVTDGVPALNPDYAPPLVHQPVPAQIWGSPVLRMPLGGSADLKGIRTGVADIAARVGLHDYDARAAVLAVHEAALLACAGGGSSNGPGPSEPVVDTGDRHVDGLLEVRVAPGSLFTEVRVPRSNAAPTSASANTSAAVDPTGHVGWFCHAVTAHDSHTDWTIRVLTDLRRSTAQGSMSLDH